MDDKYFQFAATVALTYEEVKWIPDRFQIIEPFIDKHNQKVTNYPSKIGHWKSFEKNNPKIARDTLYIKEKEIYPAYKSKHNSTREKEIIFLMIPTKEKEERWHYLAVKILSALLHGITSKREGDFYCLNYLHYFRTKNKLKSFE